MTKILGGAKWVGDAQTIEEIFGCKAQCSHCGCVFLITEKDKRKIKLRDALLVEYYIMPCPACGGGVAVG